MAPSPRVTGRKTEQFQVSVNVAPAAKITFELVYEELLKRHLGVYELLLKVRPQQLVKHLQVPVLPLAGWPCPWPPVRLPAGLVTRTFPSRWTFTSLSLRASASWRQRAPS